MKRPYAIPIDENGRCILAKEIKNKGARKQWQCTNESKDITPSEELAIINFQQAFECSIQEMRRTLDKCDECPHTHYTKTSESFVIDRKGYPLVCSIDSGCKRILRAAATHYPLLGKFLHRITACHYCACDMFMCKYCKPLIRNKLPACCKWFVIRPSTSRAS